MSYPRTEIEKRYENLPESLKELLFADETTEHIEALGQKYNLLLDKTGALSEEVGYFVLGLTHPKNFRGRIISATGVSDIQANEIIEDLNNSLFRPLRNELMALHGEGDAAFITTVTPKPESAFSYQSIKPKPIPSAPVFSSTTSPAQSQQTTTPSQSVQSPQVTETRPSATEKLVPSSPQTQSTIINDPYREIPT
ncbi:MAG: hypothetical protein AAB372_01730 [Patescibacteria group bacterium]